MAKHDRREVLATGSTGSSAEHLRLATGVPGLTHVHSTYSHLHFAGILVAVSWGITCVARVRIEVPPT